MVELRRGQVRWASLPSARGSEPAHRRPILVIQSNDFNRSQIQTVVVAVITSNLRLADAPGNVKLKTSESGLPRASVVNVSQLLTLSREYVGESVGVLPASAMNRVANGLRLLLAV